MSIDYPFLRTDYSPWIPRQLSLNSSLLRGIEPGLVSLKIKCLDLLLLNVLQGCEDICFYLYFSSDQDCLILIKKIV